MIVTIGVSIFFLLFFGTMMLGNRASHSFENILNKQADQELMEIELQMKQKPSKPKTDLNRENVRAK